MPKLCTHPNCQRPVFSKGKCGIHYQRKKLNRVSEGQRKRLEDYREKRDEFLKANPKCLVEGCNGDSSNHHARGRIGKNLTDVSTFRNLCFDHHRYFEEHPHEAKELGISLNRL